jgi:hypothetical protein
LGDADGLPIRVSLESGVIFADFLVTFFGFSSVFGSNSSFEGSDFVLKIDLPVLLLFSVEIGVFAEETSAPIGS